MNHISRRGVLAALAVGAAGRTAALPDSSPGFVLEQGDRCVPITPLSGDETVERFYDYRTPYTSPSGWTYSSYGTTDLQRPETSICFLYDGPDGLSLVVVHDELYDDTSGGAVTLQFDGLAGGSWLVGDDDYDGASNYDDFVRTADGWRVDWTWADGRTDGGVYGHLGEDFAVTIDPAFGEDAALYGDPYEGEMTDWQVLSGDRSDPERVSLSLDRPITIRTGRCGGESAGPIRPDVEIVPGKVNPRSHGRLPVVVYSSAEFDATALESVEFGPADASPVERIRTDADGDGRADLKLLFRMDETGIDWDTDEVELTGVTRGGREVEGSAVVRLVPNGEGEKDENRGDREKEQERTKEKREQGEQKDEDEDEAEDEDEKDEEAEDEDEKDEDEQEGNGRGNGKRGRGRGRGNGRGNGNHGKGRGRGNGNGRGKGNGRG